MKMNRRLMPLVVTAIVLASFLVIMPASALIPVGEPPPPEKLWDFPTGNDVADIAIGDLNGDGKEDVVAIDVPINLSLNALPGHTGTPPLWQEPSIDGYAVSVGDINGDGFNEVIAGGYNGTAWGIFAYSNSGNPLWSHPASGVVKDTEIGDIDGDGIDDVVACNTIASHVYAIDGAGNDIAGWPQVTGIPVVDLAVGQLDGAGGMDVAAIGPGGLCVYSSAGVKLWDNVAISGRTVEIGDVDGVGGNEVVVGTSDGWVRAYDRNGDGGGGSELLYEFQTGGEVMDVELGDLDGNQEDVEVAAITLFGGMLYAIDIDKNPTPSNKLMWSFDMQWPNDYYGESLAIGDIDRDYKNEVVAASSAPIHCVYAFDGVDRDGDGVGDLVWSPYCVWDAITDVEVGDLDGDGDDDVAFGTKGNKIYALAKVENTDETATGTGTVYFDSDPSTLENLTAVDESTLPDEGKPNLNFPHGFFSFNITLPEGHTTATVTITLPDPTPVGTQYWMYHDAWINVTSMLGDDDGDNILTLTISDGGWEDADELVNGVIVDDGAPGIPRHVAVGVGGEVHPVSKLVILARWIALAVAMIVCVILLMRQRIA